jgi:hypothetical protein
MLKEDGSETAKYDVDSGILTITLPKFNPGEEFPDLQMISRLIQTSGQSIMNNASTTAPRSVPSGSGIQVISSTTYEEKMPINMVNELLIDGTNNISDSSPRHVFHWEIDTHTPEQDVSQRHPV